MDGEPDHRLGDRGEVDDEFEMTQADLEVHHRLVREMVCSLPRPLSCRLCPGERDCPYIVDRPFGRLVVHRRPPHEAVAIRQEYRVTGTRRSPTPRRQLPQVLFALLAWLVLLGLFGWIWVINFPGWTVLAFAAALLMATFLQAIVGVPMVRRRWRDGGGERHRG